MSRLKQRAASAARIQTFWDGNERLPAWTAFSRPLLCLKQRPCVDLEWLLDWSVDIETCCSHRSGWTGIDPSLRHTAFFLLPASKEQSKEGHRSRDDTAVGLYLPPEEQVGPVTCTCRSKSVYVIFASRIRVYITYCSRDSPPTTSLPKRAETTSVFVLHASRT